MILADWEIRDREGLVVPFSEQRLQPASVDLLLDHEFAVYQDGQISLIDLINPTSDALKKVTTNGFILHPGEFVLASTVERVNLPSDLVGRVEGKSSLGRLGLIIHATAGFIDPGFCGQITLEIANLRRVPIVLRPYRPICQISFARCEPVEKPYQGRYQNQKGVTASRYQA